MSHALISIEKQIDEDSRVQTAKENFTINPRQKKSFIIVTFLSSFMSFASLILLRPNYNPQSLLCGWITKRLALFYIYYFFKHF